MRSDHDEHMLELTLDIGDERPGTGFLEIDNSGQWVRQK